VRHPQNLEQKQIPHPQPQEARRLRDDNDAECAADGEACADRAMPIKTAKTPALHKTAAKMDAGRTLRRKREECGTRKI